MKANQQSRKTGKSNDEGVSPVIAVILMVAITVVLAATVYVWVSGFSSEDSGPEQASATARVMATSDGDWIRTTLVRGENAPYDENNVEFTLLDPSGNSYTSSTTGDGYLCTSAKPHATAGTNTCNADTGAETKFHAGGSTLNTWDVGEVLYLPCQEKGDHAVTITVKSTTVLDTTVACTGAANPT